MQIKNRWNGNVIFEGEYATMKECVEAAIASAADLSAADLRDADLRAADLSAANLSAADLSAADLRAANLSAADLSAADLRAADLRAANLRAANLSAANLRAADLSDVRNDLYAVLLHAPHEVPALIAAVKEGRINGSCYTDGECGCLVGTLAMASGANPKDTAECQHVRDLNGHSSRPIERFFLAISKGDTPETSQVAALVYEWTVDWHERITRAFGNPAEAT